MAHVETSPAARISTSDQAGSYVEWSSIFAGTAIASAISLLLLTFGAALGLSLTSAYEGSGISLLAFAIISALWLIWVQVSGFFAGGYVAGRLRRRAWDSSESESDMRDGAHGLVVWAAGLLLGAAIAVSGLTSAASMLTATAASVGTVATAAVAGTADGWAESIGGNIDRTLRDGAQMSADDSAALRRNVMQVLGQSVVQGEFNAEDRTYLANTLASRMGIAPEQAAERVDQLWANAQAAEAQLRAAADKARQMTVIAAFINAVSMLIAAVAAYAGAVIGGNHRDTQSEITGWYRRW